MDTDNDEILSKWYSTLSVAGLILGLHPVNEKRRYKATTSLIAWVQT